MYLLEIKLFFLPKILNPLENESDETFSNNNNGKIKKTEYNDTTTYLLDIILFGKKYLNIGSAEFDTTVRYTTHNPRCRIVKNISLTNPKIGPNSTFIVS
jgi:hypothetical protein